MIQLIKRFFFGTPNDKVVKLPNPSEIKYLRNAMNYYIRENNTLKVKLKLFEKQH
jgi:hypothetical protein